MRHDQYGIPENMFGHVPEEFYALVGRVVMVAAMLEDRLLCLLWAMDDAPQQTYAGQPFSQIIKRCRSLAQQQSLSSELSLLLDEIDDAMQRRNAVVHSQWADPQLATARGWRHVVPKKRSPDWDPAVWIETSEPEIAEVIRTLVNLIERCDALSGQVQRPSVFNPMWGG